MIAELRVTNYEYVYSEIGKKHPLCKATFLPHEIDYTAGLSVLYGLQMMFIHNIYEIIVEVKNVRIAPSGSIIFVEIGCIKNAHTGDYEFGGEDEEGEIGDGY